MRQVKHVLEPGAQLLIMRGVYPLTELEEIKPPFHLVKVHPLKIPFLDAERHVIEMGFE